MGSGAIAGELLSLVLAIYKTAVAEQRQDIAGRLRAALEALDAVPPLAGELDGITDAHLMRVRGGE